MEFGIIPLDKIRPNPFQPREAFSKEELEELAESIKGSGLVQPILVRKKGETYEIIAGERRWRAAQLAGLKEIPAIIKEADDIEARELSIVENWHRQALQPIETEKFIAKLYEDGVKSGRYKSISDMAKKIGIPERTLRDIISAHEERKELGLLLVTPITYTDIRATKVLRDEPELRKRVLELRAEGKLTRDELEEYAKAVKEASEPIKEALVELKITPEEAKIIDTELATHEEKIKVLKILEKEKEAGKVVRISDVVKLVEKEKERRIEVVRAIDTGDIWECPVCHRKYHLLHIEPTGAHRFEEVVE